jgi:ADP-heptose:LPS heptosyltransferase
LRNTLIVKLNATGDVVRTTTLLHEFADAAVTWITASPNNELLPHPAVRCLEWADCDRALDRDYDLVVNLEDEAETAAFVEKVRHRRLFGAYLRHEGTVAYSDDSRAWFDLSLISVHGRKRADELKLLNRRSYQDLLFEGLGLTFTSQPYWLPRPALTPLAGDVAIAPMAGPVWPMKGWAHYDQLKVELERAGLRVNVLPRRETLLEHLGDIANHRCLVSGDSLPMHLALGTGTPCVTLFNCTSPWEIYDYGIQTKLVSPLLEQFFYKRGFDEAATTAIRLNEVFDAVIERLQAPAAVGQ